MKPKRRIIDDALYVHFVTFSVDRRRRLLDHAHPKRIVLGVLTKLLHERQARCLGFAGGTGCRFGYLCCVSSQRVLPWRCYRGRDGPLVWAAPPSEPDWQISRIRLSG
jgi:hypothetical protein